MERLGLWISLQAGTDNQLNRRSANAKFKKLLLSWVRTYYQKRWPRIRLTQTVKYVSSNPIQLCTSWKGFCTNTDDYLSPEWDGADFRVLHELFLLLRSQDHLRSLSLLGTSGLWRKNSPSNKEIVFEEENPSSSNKKMLLNKMASLVFLVLGSLAQRVKIPDLPSCEGLILSNCYVIPCKSLICFRFSRVVVPWFTKKHSFFGVSLFKGRDPKIWKK